MKNSLLLLASLLLSSMSFGQTSLKSISGAKNDPQVFNQNKTYTSCSYLQENNALEDGRVSNVSFPLICADDFIVPGSDCWNISEVIVPFFTNNPLAADSIALRIFADAPGSPGAILQTRVIQPADWTTTLIGNNYSIDVHEYTMTLNTPINICGGGAGTTYWFSAQVFNTSTGTTGDFYWVNAQTGSPYGNNGLNAPNTTGPWVPGTSDNFVFELIFGGVTGTDTQVACDSYTWIDGNTYTTSNNTATFNIVGGSSSGCDSLVTLDLTINNSTTGTDVQTACDTYTWIDGNTYTASNNTATFNIVGGAANGCDSLVTLDLTINNSTTGTDVQTACDTYTWIDGNTYTASNNTATFNIVGGAANGCDSLVTLDLTINNSATGTDMQVACDTYTWIDGNTYTASNNTATFNIVGGAANGCDSLVTLDLTINNSATGTDTQVACDTYTWIDGNTYTASNNTATFNIVGGAANGCDSLVTLDLTINNSATGTDVQTACNTYTWIDGNTYTASNNTATFNIVGGAANGCDSLVTLDLTINNSATGTDVQTACNTYTWIDGNTYTASNNTATFNIVGGAANGCDSLVTLDLTINNSTTGTDTQIVCDSLVWIDGNTYTASNNTATFNIVGGSASGCDSLVTLDLTVNYSTTGTDIQITCDSLVWIDGNTYYASNNTATFNIVGGAASGCDSLVTLDLTINNSATGTDVQTACGSFTWIDGNTYTASNNTATFNIVGGAASGCDSLVTLDLTINTVDTSVTSNDPTLTSNASGVGASYQWIDCDNGNAVIAGATSVSYTATANGNYAVIVTENGCTDTSACAPIVTVGIDDLVASDFIKIYPNPTSGILNIDLKANGTLMLFANDGKLIWSEKVLVGRLIKDFEGLAKGVYVLRYMSEHGTINQRIINQ